jgi:hypothetical protein
VVGGDTSTIDCYTLMVSGSIRTSHGSTLTVSNDTLAINNSTLMNADSTQTSRWHRDSWQQHLTVVVAPCCLSHIKL